MRATITGRASEIRVSAIITRADGRVEHLGEICYWHRNPLRRFVHRLGKCMRKGE